MRISAIATALRLRIPLLVTALLAVPFVNAQITATGLCDTGLTSKTLQPAGCRTSTLVSPVNPVDGGPSVDGNWQLATPYPTASYLSPAPNPCNLYTAYGSAYVNAPWYSWYNPDDQLSQWIEPLGGGNDSPGWYIYRTSFPVPLNNTGYSRYVFQINGQLLADDEAYTIYIEDPVGDRASCRLVADFSKVGQELAWNQFNIAAAPTFPGTHGYLYFVVYNTSRATAGENPTGIRVEFMDPYFSPY